LFDPFRVGFVFGSYLGLRSLCSLTLGDKCHDIVDTKMSHDIVDCHSGAPKVHRYLARGEGLAEPLVSIVEIG